jgi:hypothetical protein
MFEGAAGARASQGDHPGAGGEVLHGQTPEATPGGDGETADEKGLAVDVEGLENVEAEGGAGEPGGGQGRGGADVMEAEVPSHHAGQVPVEDPENHRDRLPPVTQRLPDGQAGLDVGQVGTGEDGHS